MKKVNIIWAIIPTVLFIIITGLSMSYYYWVQHTVKPHVKAQDKAIVSYIGALNDANFNTTYNGTYVLEQLKLVVSPDSAQQKQGFENVINFKAKTVVIPPQVPDAISL
jgi:uncharacterized protein YpmB